MTKINSSLKSSAKFNGFSIVEMSVVLVSIAAIVVITVGGINMVSKAKLGNILSDISTFRNSIDKFEQKYGSLPGDMADVSALPTGAIVGNGNGAIDTATEALGVWQHLSLSGFLEGKFNGTSANIIGRGVPGSDIDQGGYNIKLGSTVTATTLEDQAVVIEIAGFSTTTNDLPILSAEDAKSLDDKSDDGNPLTGNILAEEGAGATANSCVTAGGAYNVSNKDINCRVLFIIKSGKTSGDAANVTGACSQLGQSRQTNDNTLSCPKGYVGKVVQTCRISANNVGAWEVTDRNCVEVKCSDGGILGSTRNLACINGMKGELGITEECSDTGVWKVTSSDCSHDAKKPCKTNGELMKAQACDWGEKGYTLQRCTNYEWGTPTTDTCTDVVCGAFNVGASKNHSGGCGSNYTGTAKEVCTASGIWQKTSAGSSCAPVYNGACNAGVTANKNIGCPTGKTGSHILTCVEASTDYWTTLSDTCKPITCDGGENIGTTRVKKGATCSNGLNGTVMETCDENGDWIENTTNCVRDFCDSTEDLMGNAYWSGIETGSAATATSCQEGYESLSTPTRACDAGGVWNSNVTNPCTRIQCDYMLPHDHVIHNTTYAGDLSTDTTPNPLQCVHGYDGNPISNCSIDGTWSNSGLPCKLTISLPAAPILWLDAADTSTVFSNWGCTNPATAGGVVKCWKDKSSEIGSTTTYLARSLLPDQSGIIYEAKSMSSNLLPVIDFSLVHNEGLLIENYPELNLTGNLTGITAIRFPNTSIASTMLGKITTDSAPTPFEWNVAQLDPLVYDSAIIRLTLGDSNNSFGHFTSSLAIEPDIDYVLSVKREGWVISHYINGFLLSSGSPENAPFPVAGGTTPLHVGVRGDGGKMGEVFLYNSALSDVNREYVEDYLGTKWGITINH